jgi:hypothetical protein
MAMMAPNQLRPPMESKQPSLFPSWLLLALSVIFSHIDRKPEIRYFVLSICMPHHFRKISVYACFVCPNSLDVQVEGAQKRTCTMLNVNLDPSAKVQSRSASGGYVRRRLGNYLLGWRLSYLETLRACDTRPVGN